MRKHKTNYKRDLEYIKQNIPLHYKIDLSFVNARMYKLQKETK
jgi:hypothetical protein